jgi:hypothetical protein
VQDHRSVLEEDTTMNDRLAVHRDAHVVVAYPEQMVRLYDLESLVHHRG